MKLKKRLLTFCIVSAIFPFSGQAANLESGKEKRPNVLVVFTDQQHVKMMSAAGNTQIHTPNMDRLAERGIMFKRSYCTAPVCGPSRSSIVTGRMPHETGVEWNGGGMKAGIPNIGEIFRVEGYETVWGGKWHLSESYPQRPKARQKEITGFETLPFMAPNPDNWMLGSETDPPLTEAVVNYLDRYDKTKPFLLMVSYHNPHDICFYPRKEGWASHEDSLLNIRYYDFNYRLPAVVSTHPSRLGSLPPLPPNFETDPQEPEFLSDKRNSHKVYGLETYLANQEFDSLEWRGYLNAYNKLTERVDQEIGKVLEALERNGLDENTIILFTSDHGDGASAHRWAAKLSFYEESATVPFIVSFPKKMGQGIRDDRTLVSLSDIVPTLCDLVGIQNRPAFTGKSLAPVLTNKKGNLRKFLVVELADYAPDSSRKGRLVVTERYKYAVYSKGKRNEQLFDLHNDTGEMRNLAYDPKYRKVIRRHRTYLAVWIRQTKDNFIMP